MSQQHFFVRLIPVAPKQGFTVQGYMYKGFRFIGGERPTWYQVESWLADELKTLTQNQSDPYAKPLFEVLTEEEKQKVERAEQERYLTSIGAMRSTVMTPQSVAARTENLTAKGRAEYPSEPEISPIPANATLAPLMDSSAQATEGRSVAIPPEPTRMTARSATKTASVRRTPLIDSIPVPPGGAIETADVLPSRDA